MEPYQQRVIDEQEELKVKLSALGDFVQSEMFQGLPEIERDALNSQRVFMAGYSGVLSRRISRFK